MTYESEINPDNENNFVGLEQPEPNPNVLFKQLTPGEIQRACVPQQQSTLLKCAQSRFENRLEPPSSSGVDSNIKNHSDADKSTEIQQTATIEHNVQLEFECKLCSQKCESDPQQLQIHVGICALYHEDRNRFCVLCNQKFCNTSSFKNHRLTVHGTEEEKLRLFKFEYQSAIAINKHLCTICVRQFNYDYNLRRHNKCLHSVGGPKPSVCNFCSKVFSRNDNLLKHIHLKHAIAGNRGVIAKSTSTVPKKISTGQKSKCSICSLPFSNSAHLLRHQIKIHSRRDRYPFKCDICSKGFSRKENLLRHVKTLHKANRIIPCAASGSTDVGDASSTAKGKAEKRNRTRRNDHK